MVQELGLRAFTAVAWVQSLGRELRPHKLALKKKKNHIILLFYSKSYSGFSFQSE